MVENSTSNGNQGPPGLCARLQKADSGDPSLVFKAEDQTTPGLHALLIGVSAYSSLKGGPSQPQNQPNLTLSRSLGQLQDPRNLPTMLPSSAKRERRSLASLCGH